MASSNKQAEFQARQDTLREEINLLLADGKREEAIKHYQRKCACSAERAGEFVESVRIQRSLQHREKILKKTIRHIRHYA
jgi:hypothetical protein